MFEVSDVCVKSLLLYFGLQDYSWSSTVPTRQPSAPSSMALPPLQFPRGSQPLRFQSKLSSPGCARSCPCPAPGRATMPSSLLSWCSHFGAPSHGWPLMALIQNRGKVVKVTGLQNHLFLPRDHLCISRGGAVLGHQAEKSICLALFSSCL